MTHLVIVSCHLQLPHCTGFSNHCQWHTGPPWSKTKVGIKVGPRGDKQPNQHRLVKWPSENNACFQEVQRIRGRWVKWEAAFLSYPGKSCRCTGKWMPAYFIYSFCVAKSISFHGAPCSPWKLTSSLCFKGKKGTPKIWDGINAFLLKLCSSELEALMDSKS